MAGKLDSALSSAGKAMEILERLDRQHPSVISYEEAVSQQLQYDERPSPSAA